MALSKNTTVFIAEFEFEGRQKDELTFHVGDRILGLVNNGDGWWVGQLKNRKGMFPANYCREASEAETKRDVEAAAKKQEAVALSQVQIGGRPLTRKPLPKLKLQYGAWGYYMANLCAVYLFFLGIADIAWATSDKADDEELDGWGSSIVGIYCMTLAGALVLFEWKFGLQVPLLQVLLLWACGLCVLFCVCGR